MSKTDLDDTFNLPAEPAQKQVELAFTREDVWASLRWSKPVETPTKKGPRVRTTAKANKEAVDLFAREGPELYALGYTIGEWPRGSGIKVVTKWELLPERVVTERKTAIEMSRATDAEINAPCPEGIAYLGYQKAGIAFGLQRRSVLIADEMGLGKTIQAIGVLNCMPLAQKILVVCPASLKLNWRRELLKWSVKSRTVFIADSKVFPEINGVVICNYDILKKHQDIIKDTEWDLLICDEAHLLKNPKSQRAQMVLGLEATKKEKAFGMADIPGITATKKIFLTGTPIQNRTRELWPIIHYLDPIEWSSWWKYASRYCGACQDNGWDSMGAANLDELQERLRRTVMIRRLKKDVLKELPPKTRKIVEIQPDKAAAAAIRAERDIFNEEDDTDMQVKMELARAGDDLDAYKRMVDQLSSRVKRQQEDLFTLRKNTAVAKVRMPAVIEMLDDAVESSEKVIIFCHHKEVATTIAKHFGNRAALIVGDTPLQDRDQAASRFQNDPTCNVIIGSFGAMGVGWTLTAASHVILFELDWVPGNISQAEDRAHRIGQTDNVLVEHYVLEGSLDADMARRIIEKLEIIDKALDKLKAMELMVPLAMNGGSSATFDALREEGQKMTQEQKQFAHIAIKFLAAQCDGAGSLDGHGFNKLDAGIGRSLASQSSLSMKQAALARRIALKYAKTQLPADLAAKLAA